MKQNVAKIQCQWNTMSLKFNVNDTNCHIKLGIDWTKCRKNLVSMKQNVCKIQFQWNTMSLKFNVNDTNCLIKFSIEETKCPKNLSWLQNVAKIQCQ